MFSSFDALKNALADANVSVGDHISFIAGLKLGPHDVNGTFVDTVEQSDLQGLVVNTNRGHEKFDFTVIPEGAFGN